MAVVATSEGTDGEVIRQSWTQPAAFATLYHRYVKQLYRFVYRRVGPDTAEDIVAETFLAAFRRRKDYDDRHPVARAWLFGILIRELAQHHRREETRLRAMARVIPADREVDGLADGVAATVAAYAVRSILATALAGLRVGDRDALLLFAWGDLSYPEIAEALRIPVGTVRSRLNRARRIVRTALGEIDPTTEVEAQ